MRFLLSRPGRLHTGEASAPRGESLRSSAWNGGSAICLSYLCGRFHAIQDVCDHVGGPLGDGRLGGEYIDCRWPDCEFHHATGFGEPALHKP